jgi:hypothetical protein
MKYLFKTLIANHYGIAGYEVFEKSPDVYLCLQASWKGYMTGPGMVTLTFINNKWKADPEEFTEKQALVDTWAALQFFLIISRQVLHALHHAF